MTIEVGWDVDRADGFCEEVVMTLTTPDDVAEFVRRLAEPGALHTRVVHRGRPWFEEREGYFDHAVYAAIHGDYAYLSYQDYVIGKHYSVGSPDSPGAEYDDDDFPPGSGITTDQLTDAITEFLVTSERPGCLAWKPAAFA
ncbi:Imm1 family immunity protein [Actinokineospora enzanensis]|uniref:Imm1 family immunity protein n=1 Tax=Actinokineospora enzanensis TaxID=155975 RepID=UPI00035DE93C|nr:Imm1 family immunity protein [Actinokineospora enzanensis]